MSSASDPMRDASSAGPGAALAQTMRQIYDLGLTTTSGGNLSLRDENGCIWITPAGIDKGELRPEQVARVEGGDDDLGSARDSGPTPSTELPFHRAIYGARSDIRAIVHAHPVSLVAFSVVQQVPDTRVSAYCHALCGAAGFASYALPGSRRLGEEIAGTFAKGFDCVVLENHGVVVGGATLREAFERLEAFELCARTIIRARMIGHERLLSADDLIVAAEDTTNTTTNATTTSSTAQPASTFFADEERALRLALCAVARRAHEKRLITSTQGMLSARLREDVFLVTPSSQPLDRLEPSDLVVVDPEAGGSEDLAARQALHAALYRAHPEVGAIAHGYAENTAGFSASGTPLPARTIPESYMLVREPGFVSIRALLLDPESLAHVLCPDRPVMLIENDGAITLGAGILDAFDRLEVLEATAAAVIVSHPLGELTSMKDEQIAELREAFFPNGGFEGAPLREDS